MLTLPAQSPHGQCTVASGDVVNTLVAAVGAAPTATMSDQYYPATNGNNVYFTLSPAGGPFNTAWLGNASAATAASMAATTLTPPSMARFLRSAVPAPQWQTSMAWAWMPAIPPTLCCIALTITAAWARLPRACGSRPVRVYRCSGPRAGAFTLHAEWPDLGGHRCSRRSA